MRSIIALGAGGGHYRANPASSGLEQETGVTGSEISPLHFQTAERALESKSRPASRMRDRRTTRPITMKAVGNHDPRTLQEAAGGADGAGPASERVSGGSAARDQIGRRTRGHHRRCGGAKGPPL